MNCRKPRVVAEENRAECPFTISHDTTSREEEERQRAKKRKRGDETKEKKVQIQICPFEPKGQFGTMDLDYTVHPHERWLGMARYNSFVLKGTKYYGEGFVYVDNEFTIERPKAVANLGTATSVKRKENNWVARILEIRAADEYHVYARVYWMYWPDELPPCTMDGKKMPGGRQPYHGENELVASNHMDVINAVSITMPAIVNNWIEPGDGEIPDALYWRQAYNWRTRQLSIKMPYPFKVTPGVQAARHILISRSRPQRDARSKPLSLRAAATAFGTSKSDVQRHLKALETSGRPAFSDRPRGRPRNLDESEDRALVAYIMWLERCGFPATRIQVEEAANKLRATRTPPEGPVGEGWYTRFVNDHPELQKKHLIRALERDRAGFEAGELGDLEHFYSKLSEVIQLRNLTASQVLNADECGIRIGVIRERLEVLVVKKENNTRHDVVAFTNRESSTLVGCANAAGVAIPPFVVFKTWPTESWEVDGLDDRVRFARSDTGFSNAEISVDWLRHFNRYSFEGITKVQSLGITFEDWFGCDEFMRDVDNPDWIWDKPYFERPENDRIWRLLIIDGFTGKTSIEFMEYCLRFDIEIFVLPPHSTHLIQPLDVGVFQLLKAAHQQVLRSHIRDGFLNFKRSDFVARLQQIFDQGFTAHNIMNGFEKSGIFPVDGSGVIRTLREKKRDILAMSTPALHSLLPKETRFSDAREVSRHIRHKYVNNFSSPTRQRFTVIDDVLAEAVTLSDFTEAHIKSRHQRIAAANNRRKTRKQVKPSGLYLNSVTISQIRESLETSTQKEQEEELRRQRREMKKLQKQHFEQFRPEWQSQWKYDINNNGKPVHISFERWLRWSGKKRDDDVISIPDPSPRPSPSPEQLFYYDTSRSATHQRFYQRLRDNAAAGIYRSPLQDMPFPLSSDGVEFRINNAQGDHPTNNDDVTGDTDDSDYDEDGIEMLDLTQEAIEEPELPPLPPPSPTPATFSSKYHEIMSIMHPQATSQESHITALGSPLSPE